jgi:hypothetical protein
VVGLHSLENGALPYKTRDTSALTLLRLRGCESRTQSRARNAQGHVDRVRP